MRLQAADVRPLRYGGDGEGRGVIWSWKRERGPEGDRVEARGTSGRFQRGHFGMRFQLHGPRHAAPQDDVREQARELHVRQLRLRVARVVQETRIARVSVQGTTEAVSKRLRRERVSRADDEETSGHLPDG